MNILDAPGSVLEFYSNAGIRLEQRKFKIFTDTIGSSVFEIFSSRFKL